MSPNLGLLPECLRAGAGERCQTVVPLLPEQRSFSDQYIFLRYKLPAFLSKSDRDPDAYEGNKITYKISMPPLLEKEAFLTLFL